MASRVTQELCHVCEKGFGSAELQGRLVLLSVVKDTWCQCPLLGRAQDLGSLLPSAASCERAPAASQKGAIEP